MEPLAQRRTHPNGFESTRIYDCSEIQVYCQQQPGSEYFVLYELRNQAAYDKYVKSDEGARLRQHYLDAYGTKTRIIRWAMLETFNLVK